nr:uncharacterized protein LOC127328937 [Lolium perenne]
MTGLAEALSRFVTPIPLLSPPSSLGYQTDSALPSPPLVHNGDDLVFPGARQTQRTRAGARPPPSLPYSLCVNIYLSLPLTPPSSFQELTVERRRRIRPQHREPRRRPYRHLRPRLHVRVKPLTRGCRPQPLLVQLPALEFHPPVRADDTFASSASTPGVRPCTRAPRTEPPSFCRPRPPTRMRVLSEKKERILVRISKRKEEQMIREDEVQGQIANKDLVEFDR